MEPESRRLRLCWDENPVGVGLALATIALLALGVVMVHSAVAGLGDQPELHKRVDVRHTVLAAGAIVVLLIAARLSYRWLVGERRVPPILLAMLLLALATVPLVYVPGLGAAAGGRHRWVRIGPVGFQPSELVQLAMLVFLAGWLTREKENPRTFRTFLLSLGVIVVCAAAVVREDFGMASLICVTGLVVLFLAGIPWTWLAAVTLPAAGAALAFIHMGGYRKARWDAMVDPWDASNPAAYHARQSLLAVMNGGYFGRGPGHGMVKRGYLPEGHTDFIFSVFCEEWGLAGALLLIGLICLWIVLVHRIASRARDGFGRVLAAGLGFYIGFQALLHVAVDLVAAPPTGVGCPFVSSGGTRLLLMAAATGLIVSVSSRSPAGEADPAREMSARPVGA